MTEVIKIATGFAIGFALAYFMGQVELAETKEVYSKVALEKTEANRDAEHGQYITAKEAWEKELAAQTEIARLTRERDVAIERMRELSARRSKGDEGSACPAAPDSATRARCETILQRCVSVTARGEKLLREHAARHDALVEMIPK